jgi:hypothetical protein
MEELVARVASVVPAVRAARITRRVASVVNVNAVRVASAARRSAVPRRDVALIKYLP